MESTKGSSNEASAFSSHVGGMPGDHSPDGSCAQLLLKGVNISHESRTVKTATVTMLWLLLNSSMAASFFLKNCFVTYSFSLSLSIALSRLILASQAKEKHEAHEEHKGSQRKDRQIVGLLLCSFSG
jgi:hypothetical protein